MANGFVLGRAPGSDDGHVALLIGFCNATLAGVDQKNYLWESSDSNLSILANGLFCVFITFLLHIIFVVALPELPIRLTLWGNFIQTLVYLLIAFGISPQPRSAWQFL